MKKNLNLVTILKTQFKFNSFYKNFEVEALYQRSSSFIFRYIAQFQTIILYNLLVFFYLFEINIIKLFLCNKKKKNMQHIVQHRGTQHNFLWPPKQL